jgi:hypothetical protein
MMVAAAACGRESAPRPIMDLAGMLYQGERRPAEARFDIVPAAVNGSVRRAIRTPPIGRISWKLKLPAQASFRTYLAADPECMPSGKGVLFRIGISDGRTYEELLNQWVSPAADGSGWVPIRLDLSPYSGFKWSLFYHPSRMWWWIVLNTTADAPTQPGCTPRPIWGAPAILAPGHAAAITR